MVGEVPTMITDIFNVISAHPKSVTAVLSFLAGAGVKHAFDLNRDRKKADRALLEKKQDEQKALLNEVVDNFQNMYNLMVKTNAEMHAKLRMDETENFIPDDLSGLTASAKNLQKMHSINDIETQNLAKETLEQFVVWFDFCEQVHNHAQMRKHETNTPDNIQDIWRKQDKASLDYSHFLIKGCRESLTKIADKALQHQQELEASLKKGNSSITSTHKGFDSVTNRREDAQKAAKEIFVTSQPEP